jgi:hypothetical protein
MKLLLDQACLSRYFLISALLLLPFYSLAQIDDLLAEETIYQAPENWYQVEVILFTQQRNNRNEAPPKNYQLQFPENWLQLTDPDESLPPVEPLMLENTSPSARVSIAPNTKLFGQHFSLSLPPQDHLIAEQNNIDAGARSVPEASIPYKYQNQVEINNINNEPAAELLAIENIEQTAEVFVPEYEQPFIQLKAPERNLNESAAALDRRAYNVVFHQAWRFQASDPDTAPWIIIKAGATDTDRYQLEGAIRFYQSRFLHFQANLWRLKFSNSTTNSLALPSIPKKPLTAQQKVAIAASEFSENLLTLGLTQPADLSSQSTDIKIQTTGRLDTDNGIVTSKLQAQQMAQTPDGNGFLGEESAANDKYPIETIWVMNKSQRLQEGDVYYLDHPEMGAFVTIQSYQPEPVNLPTPDIDIEAEEEAEI